MSLIATAGSKLFIGTVLEMKKTDFVIADFTAITGSAWKEIGNLDSLGTLGDTSQAITQALIGEGRDKTLKGTRSAGTMEVVCAIDNEDEGQLAAIAAERTPYDYAFRLELNDRPATGASPKPSMRYFIAKVMSQAEVFDQANSVTKRNLSLAINSNIVAVAKSAT